MMKQLSGVLEPGVQRVLRPQVQVRLPEVLRVHRVHLLKVEQVFPQVCLRRLAEAAQMQEVRVGLEQLK